MSVLLKKMLVTMEDGLMFDICYITNLTVE